MEEFGWKSSRGEIYAKWNPSTVEGQDKSMFDMYGTTGTKLFKEALEKMKDHGLPSYDNVKIMDIGCSSGGKMAIMHSLGIQAQHIHGIDVCCKAIDLVTLQHPDFQVKSVQGFHYNVFEGTKFDLVYHCAVFCTITEDQYPDFFQGIRSLHPDFYMYFEGHNNQGLAKAPLAMSNQIQENCKEDDGQSQLLEFLKNERFTYVDLGKIIEKYMPEARLISKQIINIQEDKRAMYDALNVHHSVLAIYKMN